MASSDAKHARGVEDRFYGLVTVGERGQIVIPAEARKRHGIETGDKLLIMGTPDNKGLMLCNIEAFRDFMNKMLENIQRVETAAETDESEDQG
ncbi:MAG: AbrB/MazE/SpoVT family DNA-binding domain-containing protein [Capsulimonadaceae bacterium]